MSAEAASLADKVIGVVNALEGAGIAYAIGGAMALSYYAVPRATDDIDVNVFVDASGVAGVRTALEARGVRFPDDAAETVERDGQVRCWWGPTPLDLFFLSVPLHDEMQRDAVAVHFEGRTMAMLSANHLAVCKALFNRTKDWADIEAMLTAGALDIVAVSRALEPFDAGAAIRRLARSAQRVRKQMDGAPDRSVSRRPEDSRLGRRRGA